MRAAIVYYIAKFYRPIPTALLLAALLIPAPLSSTRADEVKAVKRPVVEVDTSVLLQYGRAPVNPTANPVATQSGRLTEPERFTGDKLVAPVVEGHLKGAGQRKALLTGAPPAVEGVPVASAPVPAPIKKPVQTVQQDESAFPLIANPPIPPRRPATQYASKDFVKQAREKALPLNQAAQYQVRHQPMPGVPAMPARPAGKVLAEATYLPKGEEAENILLKRMMQMDRTQVLAGVQDVAGRTEKSASPSPSTNLPAAMLKSTARYPVPSGPDGPVTSERISAQTDIGTEKIAANAQTDLDADHLAGIAPAAGAPAQSNDELSLATSGSALLNEDLRRELHEKIIPAMQQDRNIRLQLQSFADNSMGGPLSARRTALSRALAVRAFLLEQGVEGHRLEMRALGLNAAGTPDAPANRVDLLFIRDQST